MANFDQVRNAANEIAESAKKLAEMADQAAAAAAAAEPAHALGLDPFMFLLSIFAMACFVG